MTDREKFVLKIMLQNIGLDIKEANALLTDLESRKKTYKLILTVIERLQEYFEGEQKYDRVTFCNILTEPRIYECSIEKIKSIDSVLAGRDYNYKERKQVAAGYPNIFASQNEKLDKKLVYYNDIKIKKLLIGHPRHFMQSLELTYARQHFLTEKEIFEDKQKDLFLPEIRFIGAYGIENNNINLKTRYPVKEAKYLIKK